jgi:FAD binding domain
MSRTLSGRVRGPVFKRGDDGYAAEIAAFNTVVVHTPDLVVGVTSPTDIVEAIRFAREQGHRVAVQGAGHGAHAPVTSGLMISTRRLDRVTIEPTTGIATLGAGVRWSSVVPAAAEHGLAPVAGSSTHVGAVGYLLGGGLGPLARSHGVSSDYLVGATVVAATGEVVEADPELLWALRGGKPSLGVIAEIRVRLVPLRTFYAGALFFDEAHIGTALRAWIDWTADADPRVTTSIAIVRYPPLDAIPEPLRGRRLLNIRFAFPGSTDEGVRLAAPLRAIAPLHLDVLGEMPAPEIARIHNDPTEPGPGWVAAMLLSGLDQSFATAFLGQLANAPYAATEIRHLGEATQRDVPEGSAVSGRGAGFTLGFADRTSENFATVLPAALERMIAAVSPWISPEKNINFMGKPRSPEHFVSAWPAAIYARIREIQRKYDPDGMFTPAF